MALIQQMPYQSVKADFGDGEIEIFYRPINLYEMDKIQCARKVGDANALAETLILRARDKTGDRIFDRAPDKDKILCQYDPHEVMRIATILSGASDERPAGNG